LWSCCLAGGDEHEEEDLGDEEDELPGFIKNSVRLSLLTGAELGPRCGLGSKKTAVLDVDDNDEGICIVEVVLYFCSGFSSGIVMAHLWAQMKLVII